MSPHTEYNTEVDSLIEFPKKDVQVKIDKKDLVFIHEIDDVIQSINQNAIIKELK